MDVKWLRTALKNLNDQAEHIAEDNPTAAKNFVKHIYESVNLLANNPALGHPGRVHGTHELIIDKTFIVPYRVRPQLERIEILRIFHTSRKPVKRW